MTIVTIGRLSISRPLAVVVSSVATITMVSSTVSSVVSPMAVVASISGLSISRPLAIVTMMSVGVRRSVSVSVMSVSAIISGLSSGSGLSISLSLSLSISGPLAVVVASVTTIVPSTVTSVTVAATIIPIAWLGSNNSEEDDGESNQKFHVVRSSFST